MEKFTLVSAAPTFNMEVLGDATVTFHLGYVELTLVLRMYPFKFTPFDILFRVDSLHPKRFCWGMDYLVDTFLAQVFVEWKVNECAWGVAGIVTGNDPSDCFWKSYKPQLPIWQTQFQNIGNVNGTYVDYNCANWYTANWQNWPITEEYLALHQKD